MYNMIIIDDVEKNHELLSNYMNNVDIGVIVRKCFSNAIDAIEYIKENDVDILLTDIKMLLMSGIELMEFLYNNFSQIKTIIMSTYNDFECAKSVIQCNDCHYILKPIDLNELSDVLTKVVNTLTREKSHSSLSKENIDENKKQFIYDLITDTFSDANEIQQKIELFFPSLKNNDIYINFYDIVFLNYSFLESHWEYEKELLVELVEKAIQSHVSSEKSSFIPLFSNNEHIIFTVVSDNKNILTQQLKSYLHETFSLDTCCKMICSPTRILDIHHVKELYDNPELRQLIVHNISTYSSSVINNIISKFFKNNIRLEMPADNIIHNPQINIDIIAEVKKYINENLSEGITRDSIALHFSLSGSYFSKYFKNSTGISVSEYIRDTRIKKAMEFINMGVSLQKIPEMIGISSYRHFQRIFKKTTGYTPSEYKKNILYKEK